MGKKELLARELEQVPESYVDEVLSFVRLLQGKIMMEGLSIAAASESSLGKDWLSPEEEDAWRGL